MKLQPILATFCLMVSWAAIAMTSEHILWEKIPVSIQLPLDEERLIRFAGPISIVDSELEKQAGIMKMEDSLYLHANQAFKNKRLVVQLMPEGEVIVLTCAADENYHNVTPIEVLLPEKDEALSQTIAEKAGLAGEQAAAEHINPVSLTRFAIQSLYAPARLLVTLEGLTRTPMQTQKTVPLVYGASVRAHPLISWGTQGLYVTAVELKNELNKKIILDPRNLLGEWQTATFYPTNTLNPRGTHETTTVFLVSSRPFGEALSAFGGYVR